MHLLNILFLKFFVFLELYLSSKSRLVRCCVDRFIDRSSKDSTLQTWLTVSRHWLRSNTFHDSGCFGAIEKISVSYDGSRKLLHCKGWIFHRDTPIDNLWFFNGHGYFCSKHSHLKRVDVECSLPIEAHALLSGFEATFPSEDEALTTERIYFFAELDTGRLVQGSLEILSHSCPHEKTPPPTVVQRSTLPPSTDICGYAKYNNYLRSQKTFRFRPATSGQCTVIIHSNVDPSSLYHTLRSLNEDQMGIREIIVVVPKTATEFHSLLSTLSGITILQIAEGQSQSQCLTYAALSAAAPCILFLKSGLELFDGLPNVTSRVMKDSGTTGAFTGITLSPQGLLVEAGLQISSEGDLYPIETFGTATQLLHERDVEVPVTSLNLLLTLKSHIEKTSGLDTALINSKALGTAFCLRIQQMKLKTFRTHSLIALDHTIHRSAEISPKERTHLLKQWGHLFSKNQHVSPSLASPTLIYLTDDVPVRSRGLRHAASARIIKWLDSWNALITVGITQTIPGDWGYLQEDLTPKCELQFFTTFDTFFEFVSHHRDTLKTILVDGENAKRLICDPKMQDVLAHITIVSLDSKISRINTALRIVEIETGFSPGPPSEEKNYLRLDANNFEFERQLHQLFSSI